MRRSPTPQSRGILLDIDSPGGEAGGVFELAERIRAGQRTSSRSGRMPTTAALLGGLRHRGCRQSRLTLSQTGGRRLDRRHCPARRPVGQGCQGRLRPTPRSTPASTRTTSHPHAPLSPQAGDCAAARGRSALRHLRQPSRAACAAWSPMPFARLEAGLVFGEAAVHAGLADARRRASTTGPGRVRPAWRAQRRLGITPHC